MELTPASPWRVHAGGPRRAAAAARARACASASPGAASTQPDALASLPSAATKGQLYEATLGDGSMLWLEVVGAKGPRLQVVCYGEAIELSAQQGAGTAVGVRAKGGCLQ